MRYWLCLPKSLLYLASLLSGAGAAGSRAAVLALRAEDVPDHTRMQPSSLQPPPVSQRADGTNQGQRRAAPHPHSCF